MAIENKFLCGIVLFNPAEDVIDQLKIYLKTFGKVFLYDNSYVKAECLNEISEFSNVIYESHTENNGMTGAINSFLDYAKKYNYDWVVTMDQDSVFSCENIIKMMNYINEADEKRVAIYTTNFNKIYWKGDTPIYTEPIYPTDKNTEVEWHISSGNFLNVKIVTKFTPFDDYFIAFVDYDLDFTLRKEGYKIIVIGDSVISQQIGQKINYSTLAKIGLTNMSPERFYYLMRNNLYFTKKFKGYPKAKKFARSRRIRYAAKLLLSEKQKILKIKMMIKGYKDYKNNVLGRYEG